MSRRTLPPLCARPTESSGVVRGRRPMTLVPQVCDSISTGTVVFTPRSERQLVVLASGVLPPCVAAPAARFGAEVYSLPQQLVPNADEKRHNFRPKVGRRQLRKN